MRGALACVVFLAAACGGNVAILGASSSPTVTTSVTAGPRVAVPTASLQAGTCTRAGMTGWDLIQRWLMLAGQHDPAAVRDCFAPSYGVPDAIVDRWANLGGVTSAQVSYGVDATHNGCDFFTVRATFPGGNPYAPVQAPNDMFFVVGVGADGDRPRIFGTATADISRSPDVTPHAGPPDCQ